MKNKNGFTLIELVAVVVILSIIALISSLIIINVIDNIRRKAFENSSYGVLEGLKLNYTESIMYENSIMEKVFEFPNSGLKLSGEEPSGGKAKIESDGKIEFAIHDKDKKWCAKKKLTSEKVEINNYSKEKCILDSEIHISPTINYSIDLYNEDQNASLLLDIKSDSNINTVKYIKGKVTADVVVSDGILVNKDNEKYIINGISENGYYTIYSQDEDGDYSLNYIIVEGIVVLEGNFDDLYINGSFGELTQSWGTWKRNLNIETKNNVNIVDARYTKKYVYDTVDAFENDKNYGNKIEFTNKKLNFTAEGL